MFTWLGMFRSKFALIPIMAICLVNAACTDEFFGSDPKRPQENKTPESLAPNETNTGEKNKSVLFELAPAPPESWWNNCVEILYKGKVLDAGCAKTKGGLKSVSLEVGKEETCIAVAVRVNTFKNVGSTCSERFAKGLPCEGPYGESPDMVRTSNVEGEAGNFKWQSTSAGSESVLKFEDQPAENIAAVKADASKAEDLGVDFNDVVLTMRPAGVQVVLMSVEDAKRAAAGEPSQVCGQ